jgi:hypothetical protein
MSHTLHFIAQAITAGTQHVSDAIPASEPTSGSPWWTWLILIAALLIAIAFVVKLVTGTSQTQRSAPPEPLNDAQPAGGSVPEVSSTSEPDRAIYVSVTILLSTVNELKGDISLGALTPAVGAQLLSKCFTWSSSPESKLPPGVELNGNEPEYEVTFVAECRCVCPQSVAEKVLKSPSNTSVAIRLKKSAQMELVSLRYGTSELINIVEEGN